MYWMGQEGQRDDVEAVMQAIGSQMPKLGKKECSISDGTWYTRSI